MGSMDVILNCSDFRIAYWEYLQSLLPEGHPDKRKPFPYLPLDRWRVMTDSANTSCEVTLKAE